jgi:hypothetical protein
MCNQCKRTPFNVIRVDGENNCIVCGESVGRFNSWNEQELNILDKKFDALCEYLKVEFVNEVVSDGSDYGDTERFYCRKKK